MLQQPTSLNLGLTYNVPESLDMSPESYSNYSYWSGPDISNVTGDVVAVLDKAGSFGIVYVSSSDGAVYVYKNDGDYGGQFSAVNQSNWNRLSVLQRLILEANGNLHLYRWDNDVNGSRQWVAEWAAVSNSCDIAGICGNGICNLDRSKTSTSCSCLPGSSKVGNDVSCSGNSSLTEKCGPHHENLTSQFKIYTVQQMTYYFSASSVIANYSDIDSVTQQIGVTPNCDCIASVYGLNEEKPYCWVLRSLEFGGFEDPGSTLFVKVEANGSFGVNSDKESGNSSDESESTHEKVLILPIVLSLTVLIVLLGCLLYINIHRKRSLKRALDGSLILSGAPISFSFRDLQHRTNNFPSGFGSVYKGSLGDGTLRAVKKLDKVLPHGEREFITEVNTIGSMHHMNLVRLCGYCSEGTRRCYFFFFQEMTEGTPEKIVDRQLGAIEKEELMRALMVAFWCIQDEVSTRPTMGEVVKILEGSVDINMPPMPKTVLELIEEGLDHVYKV
ncbi:hypothetical protein RND71_030226 [Anisodus tanguticus]|uniref:Protein kinase domain-containing protein n=1 Tax=Anisodus tanguticus TaxID=243964 RepID=A0AAE1RH47_9SOLA|nr:hypothetical protein RND71_030226 [Anisodus tanguticus]